MRLVRAHSRRGAVKHATRAISAEIASQDDLIALTTKGVKVETASAAEDVDDEPVTTSGGARGTV